MGTIDVMPDAGSSGSATATLRFWDRVAPGAQAGTAPRYVLNTQVSDPHRSATSCCVFVSIQAICQHSLTWHSIRRLENMDMLFPCCADNKIV